MLFWSVKNWSCLNKKLIDWKKCVDDFLRRMLFLMHVDARSFILFFGFGLFILVCFRRSSHNLLEMLDEDFVECFNHICLD